MKRTSTCLQFILATGALLSVSYAQQPPPPANGAPPPPPPAGAAPPPDPNAPQPPRASVGQSTYSRRGTIKSFNIGPNGETNGVALRDGTVIMFPPEFGTQLRSTVREGSRITVAGVSRPGVSGQTVVAVQTITYKGQVMTVPVAPAAGAGMQAGSPPPDPNTPPPPRGPKGRRRGPPPPPNGAPPPPANAGPPPAGAAPPANS